MATPIGEYESTVLLGVSADTGGHANPTDAGAQVGEQMQNLGSKIAQVGGSLSDLSSMHQHIEAQQWVSKTMADHRNTVDRYMADPNNYTDPKFAQNVQQLQNTALPLMQKAAPSTLARKQLTTEFNDFSSSRFESASKTQTDVMMQKGYSDFAMAPNTLLDNYRTNLKNPNVDAGTETYKQTDDLFNKIDNSFGKIAPTMARELKDQVTSQMAYGVVNTNPDLAQKILDRGYLEGRTRHFLEDAIQTARGAQDLGFKQEAMDATKGLLTKAEMFPDQVVKGFPPEYFVAHGYKPKEAGELSAKLQYQLDVNKDSAQIRDTITGGNEQSLLKKQDELYSNLKSLDPSSDKFNHDAQVLDRVQKFVGESVKVLHEDPVRYLSTYNKEIASATQAYRDNPSPEKFNTLSSTILHFQGAPPTGDTSGKYLNLAMHEMHLLDKSQAEDIGKQILGAGPKQAGEILHNTIQQYKPDDQGIVLSDLVNHGKIPIETYAMERTYGAPFSSKLNGAILNSKALHETVGRQKGSTTEDIDKLLLVDNTWQTWSKVTASDNFQRQDVVAGFKGAVQTYAMGMVQDGKPVKEAVASAVYDLTQWGHTTANVNGRSVQFQKNEYPGTSADFSHAVKDALGVLDVNRIKLTDDTHRQIFPVLSTFGHGNTANEALRYQIQHRVVPNINPDGKSFSLYYSDSGNNFQLRDKDNKPFNMAIKDLPTYTWYSGTKSWEGNRITHWPSAEVQTQDDRDKEMSK